MVAPRYRIVIDGGLLVEPAVAAVGVDHHHGLLHHPSDARGERSVDHGGRTLGPDLLARRPSRPSQRRTGRW
jgi:hypothetical protein